MVIRFDNTVVAACHDRFGWPILIDNPCPVAKEPFCFLTSCDRQGLSTYQNESYGVVEWAIPSGAPLQESAQQRGHDAENTSHATFSYFAKQSLRLLDIKITDNDDF